MRKILYGIILCCIVCVACNSQKNGQQENTIMNTYIKNMDSCRMMVQSDDVTDRFNAKKMASMLVLAAMHDASVSKEDDAFRNLLQESDTVCNQWYFSKSNKMFVQKIVCEEDCFSIYLPYDNQGQAHNFMLVFPDDAGTVGKLSFTNSSDSDIRNGKATYAEVDEDIKYDNAMNIGVVDSSHYTKFQNYNYLYLLYRTKSDSLKSSRLNLDMFHKQYHEVIPQK